MTRREDMIKRAIDYEWRHQDNMVDPADSFMLRDAYCNGWKAADAHPQSPWISVEDRLPEEQLNESGAGKGFSKRVLVRFERVYEHGQKDIDYDTSNYMNVTKTWLNHNRHYVYFTDRITHWMPIPELLKGGEK